MDRGNGGDPLAPPRPPKSLPRVHRPRAPEPSMMSAPLTPVLNQRQQQQELQQQQQQQQQQHQQQQQISRSNSTVSTISSSSNLINNNNNNNNNNNSHHNNNNSSVISQQRIPITAPLIPLHTNSPANFINLSNNNLNHISTTITPTNSFTRRRPPPPIINLPLLPSSHNQQNSNLLGNNNPVESPTTPVTLAAPRPENERLGNEYVDTPFSRAAQNLSTTQTAQLHQQLHNTTRTQHPAGQNVHGQTTTHHSLLQSQRQQLHQLHQHNNQQQIHSSHSNVISNNQTTTTTATTTGGGGSGGGSSTILHSNNSHKSSSNNDKLQKKNYRQQHQPPSNQRSTPITQPITKQPASFSKDTNNHDDLDIHHIGSLQSQHISGNLSDALNSITCPQCKKCRCEQCQSPRQLPSRWVCNKTCLCSAETIIDYASCLCCVKALFYHCSKDHEMECGGDDGESISCADDPCSCLPHKRAQRWGWLGALSLALPCLWCYWPMRGCIAVCAKCYARHVRHGCRCNQASQIGSTSSMLPIIQLGSGTGNDSNNENSNHHGKSANNHGISGSNNNSGINRLIRTGDLAPEKRLLDSSPEY